MRQQKNSSPSTNTPKHRSQHEKTRTKVYHYHPTREKEYRTNIRNLDVAYIDIAWCIGECCNNNLPLQHEK